MAQEIRWQKSSYSGGDDNQDCIEVAASADGILIRESDDPDVILPISSRKLATFIQGVKAGGFGHLT